MANSTREKAGWNKLGIQRHQRYTSAFDRVVHCIDAKYYLEAIAILDSLINDRLASRLGHLLGQDIPSRLTTGDLCRKLVGQTGSTADSGAEKDEAFCVTTRKIQQWVKDRNHAMHATAKILRSNEALMDFNDLLVSHGPNATLGVELLREFDRLDTSARREKGKSPATRPNAFFPELRRTTRSRRASGTE